MQTSRLFDDSSWVFNKFCHKNNLSLRNIDGNKVSNELFVFHNDGHLQTHGLSVISDDESKDSIKDLSGVNIDNLNPVKYLNKFTNKNEYGILLSDLEKVIPEAVNSIHDIKSIDWIQLIPILVKEIQELKKEIGSFNSDSVVSPLSSKSGNIPYDNEQIFPQQPNIAGSNSPASKSSS